MSGYTAPQPNNRSAARGTFRDALAKYDQIDARLNAVEGKLSGGAFNQDLKTPVAAVPALANVAVAKAAPGQVTVAITKISVAAEFRPFCSGLENGNAGSASIATCRIR